MRGLVLFGAGMLVGGLLTQTGTAQDREVRGLNHVGMVVADYPKAMDFYTKTMGFTEAYTMRRPDGRPILTYLQLSRDTFVELIPAAPGQTPAQARFARMNDLGGVPIELMEFGPGSMQRKAMDSWKR